MGSATAPLTGTGIFIGKDGSDYEFRAGDPAGTFIHWDGSDLRINGTILTSGLTADGDLTVTGDITLSGADIINSLNRSATRISGDVNFVSGANIILVGSNSASGANDIKLSVGTTTRLHWDDSAGDWTATGAFNITGALDVGTSITLGNDIFMEGTAPKFRMHETDAAASEGEWDLIAEAGLMRFRTLADGGGSGENIFTVARTGTVVDLLHVENGDFQVSDNVGIGQAPGSAALEVTEATAGTATTFFTNSHASDPLGIRVDYSAAAPNGTGNHFVIYLDSSANRMAVRSNGGIENFQSNDVDLSDERLKQKYGRLESTWDAHKAIEFWNFKYLENLDSRMMVGVMSQQVGRVAPSLFCENGWGDGRHHAVHSKDLTVYTARTVQECQARIVTNEEKIRRLADEVRELKLAA